MMGWAGNVHGGKIKEEIASYCRPNIYCKLLLESCFLEGILSANVCWL
jgi:hypothetical protein